MLCPTRSHHILRNVSGPIPRIEQEGAMKRLRVGVKFLVVTSVSVALPVRAASAQSQTPGQITQFDPSLSVVDSVITQDPSGNIGIGTATPGAALDVVAGAVAGMGSVAL